MADAQAFIEAQRHVELGKIPIWSGDDTKDTFSAEQWIERIDRCRETANWDDQATVGYLYQALRGRAIHWFTSAKFRRVNTADYLQVREDFLKVYAPTKTIRSTIANLEVKQNATESVCDYASRVTIIVNDLYSIIEPYADPAAAALFGPVISAVAGVIAVALADRVTVHNSIRLIGEDRVIQLIAVNLFIAGLKSHIRQKMVVRRYHTFGAAFDAAMNFEVQLSEPKKNATVLAVDFNGTNETARSDSESENSDEEEDDLVAEINKLSAKLSKVKVKKSKNKQSYSSTKPRQNSGGGDQRRSGIYGNCRYCKQPGHLQYTCAKRKADRAPMVGQDGRPYQRRVQEVTQVSPYTSHYKENPPTYQSTQEVAGIWQSPLNY